MTWRKSQDSWGLFPSACTCTHFCNVQTFATFCRGLGLSPPASQERGRMQLSKTLPSAYLPPPSQCPETLSLFSPYHFSPFLCPRCVGRQEGRTWNGAVGWSARGCKGPGATSQGSGIQGGTGESTCKLPCSWCQGVPLNPWVLWGLAPLGWARGLLMAILPALWTDGRMDGHSGLPSCLVYHYTLLPPWGWSLLLRPLPRPWRGPRAALMLCPAACTAPGPRAAGWLRRRSRWPWPAPPALCSCPGGHRSCWRAPGGAGRRRARPLAQVRARRRGARVGSRCCSRSAPCA